MPGQPALTCIPGLLSRASIEALRSLHAGYLSAGAARKTANLPGFFPGVYWQYIVYDVGGEAEWHVDSVGATDRKWSLSLQMSDGCEYEGGDLVIRVEDDIVIAPRGIGSLLVFDSSLMHCVVPVTRGRRTSLIGFASY